MKRLLGVATLLTATAISGCDLVGDNGGSDAPIGHVAYNTSVWVYCGNKGAAGAEWFTHVSNSTDRKVKTTIHIDGKPTELSLVLQSEEYLRSHEDDKDAVTGGDLGPIKVGKGKTVTFKVVSEPSIYTEYVDTYTLGGAVPSGSIQQGLTLGGDCRFSAVETPGKEGTAVEP